MTEAQVTAFLRRIACPTLLLRAVPGMDVPAGFFEARLASIADLRLVERPGGHHIHLDDPTSVAEVVSSFLHAP
jgi:pimeloyl-ACP methyl ester carboxylesterase